jgi:two-component system response regulator
MRSEVILLVEDNPDDVKQTLRSFARNNIANEVVVAQDGAEALESLFGEGRYAGRDPARQPGLVLLDLKLPRVTGLEVLQRIRADARTRDVPVVVLTSSAQEQDLAESYALGANLFLSKPIHFALFLNAARSLGLYWTLVESGLALLHGVAASRVATHPEIPVPASRLPLEIRPMDILLGTADGALGTLLTEELQADGHTISRVTDAMAAFRHLFNGLPDVVIMDCQLPDIRGVEVLRAVRGAPHGRGVATVLLADNVEVLRREMADDTVHILAKPVDLPPLLALMRELRLSALMRDLAPEIPSSEG